LLDKNCISSWRALDSGQTSSGRLRAPTHIATAGRARAVTDLGHGCHRYRGNVAPQRSPPVSNPKLHPRLKGPSPGLHSSWLNATQAPARPAHPFIMGGDFMRWRSGHRSGRMLCAVLQGRLGVGVPDCGRRGRAGTVRALVVLFGLRRQPDVLSRRRWTR